MNNLAITHLKLFHFRNYDSAEIRIPLGNSIILTGQNGAGKTNILEAISLLVPGRGFRNAKLSELEQFSADPEGGWAVFAEIATPEGEITIGTGKNKDKPSDKRMVRINGDTKRGQAELAEYMAVAALTPAMDQTFTEGATSRRAYLDRLTTLFFPDATRHQAIYNHAKSERLKLLSGGKNPLPLREGAGGGVGAANSGYGVYGENPPPNPPPHGGRAFGADPYWLNAIEHRMAEHGVAIAAARLETVELLQGMMGEGAFPHALLAIEGETEHALQHCSALEAERQLAASLAASRPQDAISGHTFCGIHKSDFRVTHSVKNMPAELCSTGEQKALLLSLTLASARARLHWRGVAPILLLDEVVAHLDAEKRAALFRELHQLGAQCWLTGTDKELFADFRDKISYFTVENGRVMG